MLAAIEQSRHGIELEIYTFDDDEIGRRFLVALMQAAARGVQVRVLADAFGSFLLPKSFF